MEHRDTSLHDLITRTFATIEAKDLEAMMGLFAEDAVVIDPHFATPRMQGKAAITESFRGAISGMRSFGYTIVNYFESDQYTVVSYDRRGYSRSPLDDPEEEQRIETHSDDAHHLLAQLCTEPAYVFGSSGGALIGLDLAIRHPEQVRTLVSHEPPVGGLFPDAERPRLPLRDPQKFAASIGVSFNDREPDAEMPYESPEAKARIAANRAFLFDHEAPMYPRYTLDVAALSAAPTRIVIAARLASRGYFPHQTATLLANRLGKAVVEFPSHHAGYVSHPRAFTEQLRAVLTQSAQQGREK